MYKRQDESFNRKDNLKIHYNACSTNPAVMKLFTRLQEKDNTIKEQELSHKIDLEIEISKNESLKKRLLEYEVALESKRDEILALKRQNNKLENRMERIASRPNSVSHIHNDNSVITNHNLIVADQEVINVYSKNLTIEHLKEGALGIAKFAIENSLKNTFIVTDENRKIIKYRDSIEEKEGSIDSLRIKLCNSLEDVAYKLKIDASVKVKQDVDNDIMGIEEGMDVVITISDNYSGIVDGKTQIGEERSDFVKELDSGLLTGGII